MFLSSFPAVHSPHHHPQPNVAPTSILEYPSPVLPEHLLRSDVDLHPLRMHEMSGILIPIDREHRPDHDPQDAIVHDPDPFLLDLAHHLGAVEVDERTAQVVMVVEGGEEAQAIAAIVAMTIEVGVEAEIGADELDVECFGNYIQRWSLGRQKGMTNVLDTKSIFISLSRFCTTTHCQGRHSWRRDTKSI